MKDDPQIQTPMWVEDVSRPHRSAVDDSAYTHSHKFIHTFGDFMICRPLVVVALLVPVAAADGPKRPVDIQFTDVNGRPLKDVTVKITIAGLGLQGSETFKLPSGHLKTECESDRGAFIRTIAEGYQPSVLMLDKSTEPLSGSIPLREGVRGGGTVVDHDGNAVSDATVLIEIPAVAVAENRGRISGSFPARVPVGPDGKWATASLPSSQDNRGNKTEVRLSVEAAVLEGGNSVELDAQYATLKELAARSHQMVVPDAVTVPVRITSAGGEPIAGANVVSVPYDSSSPSLRFDRTTDSNGETSAVVLYKPELSFRERRRTFVFAFAKGYTSVRRELSGLEKLPTEISLTLEESEPLRITVVDPSGKPLPEARVRLPSLSGYQMVYQSQGRLRATDKDGVWALGSPPSEPIEISVRHGRSDSETYVLPGTTEYRVVLGGDE